MSIQPNADAVRELVRTAVHFGIADALQNYDEWIERIRSADRRAPLSDLTDAGADDLMVIRVDLVEAILTPNPVATADQVRVAAGVLSTTVAQFQHVENVYGALLNALNVAGVPVEMVVTP